VFLVGGRAVLGHAAERDGLHRVLFRVANPGELPALPISELPPASGRRVEVLREARVRRIRLQERAGPGQLFEVDRLADLLAIELRTIASEADGHGFIAHRPPIGAGGGRLRTRRGGGTTERDGDGDGSLHDRKGLSHAAYTGPCVWA
jgi:hypothetical protein